MKARSAIPLLVLVSALFSTALPARAGTGGWNDNYYDTAWGMPMAVVVPPTARWQTDYSWGVGGTRVTRIGAQFYHESSGPESFYQQGNYMPAPPQPSDTQQMGDYNVRGPRQGFIFHRR